MFKHLRQVLQGNNSMEEEHQKAKRLLWIPIAFIILRLFGSINAIKDVISPDTSWFVLNVLEAIGDQSQGTVHGIVFVLINKTFQRWFKRIILTCCSNSVIHDDKTGATTADTALLGMTSSDFDSIPGQKILGNSSNNDSYSHSDPDV